MKNNQRLHYIDIIKGIGIFLVVLGHVYRGNIIQNWIYSFHMPLFFIISGWLFGYKNIEPKDFLEITKKKVMTLMLPYIEFYLLSFLYWCMVERYFREFDQGPLWFLPVLLIIELLGLVLIPIIARKNIRNIAMVIIAIFFVAFSIHISKDNIYYIWAMRIIAGFFWYYCGWYFNDLFRKKVESMIEVKSLILCTILLASLSFYLGCLNGRVDVFLAQFNNLALYIICGFLGTAVCYGVALILKKNMLLEFLGKYSLLVMCTHEPIKRAVIKIISVLTKTNTDIIRNGYFSGILITVLVVLAEIVFIGIWRYFYKVSANKWYNFLFKMAR